VYITQDNDSADVFLGIDNFCQFFAFKDFLSYRPLKIVWADLPTAKDFLSYRPLKIVLPTAVSVRVNVILNW
jgi:hypothetical protein